MKLSTLMRTDRSPAVWRARAAVAGQPLTPIQAATTGKRYHGPCEFALFGHMFGTVNTGQPRRRRM
jgi:hypothetical protein